MTEQQSALEMNEQHGSTPTYIYPDDAIKIVQIDDERQRQQALENVLNGTTQGTTILHPDLALVTFLVLCSDRQMMNRILEFKRITPNILTTQQELIQQELNQIEHDVEAKRHREETPSPYEQQMVVAHSYIDQAFDNLLTNE